MEKFQVNQGVSRRLKSSGRLPWISGSREVTQGTGNGRIYSIILVSSSSDASFSRYSHELLRELAHRCDEIQLIYLQISQYISGNPTRVVVFKPIQCTQILNRTNIFQNRTKSGPLFKANPDLFRTNFQWKLVPKLLIRTFSGPISKENPNLGILLLKAWSMIVKLN